MGSAAILQLAAYGAQDIYLTAEPQISYFKNIYKRHTPFAMEQIELPINGVISPGANVSIIISRNGDLLKGLWIQYNPSKLIKQSTKLDTIASDLSHALIDSLDIEIGGQIIDRHYGKWLTIWRDLTEFNPYSFQGTINNQGTEYPSSYRYLYPTKLGDTGTTRPGEITILQEQSLVTKYQTLAYTHNGFTTNGDTGIPNVGTTYAPSEAYVPLQFWFCKNPGLALPLIALQYHEVKLNIKLSDKKNFLIPKEGYSLDEIPVDLTSIKVFADYIYLDSTERKKFAQDAHEYLIDQLQLLESEANKHIIDLNFNHPVKELIFSGKPQMTVNNLNDDFYISNIWGGATPYPIIEYSDKNNIPYTECTLKIVLNQNDRNSARNLKYFTRYQIKTNHSGSGSVVGKDCIGIYSFSLKPEDPQPSGTCNFSRIDRAQLIFERIKPDESLNALDIYAINYNIFRVQSGMGGLAYSN